MESNNCLCNEGELLNLKWAGFVPVILPQSWNQNAPPLDRGRWRSFLGSGNVALGQPGRWWMTVLLLINSRLRISRLGSLACLIAVFHGNARSIFHLFPWKTWVPSGSSKLAVGQAYLWSRMGALQGGWDAALMCLQHAASTTAFASPS